MSNDFVSFLPSSHFVSNCNVIFFWFVAQLCLKKFFPLEIKKNFLISKSVDEIPLMPPEVENDESTSFWLNNIGLAVVVVKKNGSLLMIELNLLSEFNLLSLPLSLLPFLKLLLLNTLLFLFFFAELLYNEFGSEGINLGYLVANFTLFGSIISLKVSNSVWNGSVDFIFWDNGDTFLGLPFLIFDTTGLSIVLAGGVVDVAKEKYDLVVIGLNPNSSLYS